MLIGDSARVGSPANAGVTVDGCFCLTLVTESIKGRRDCDTEQMSNLLMNVTTFLHVASYSDIFESSQRIQLYTTQHNSTFNLI